MSFELPNLDSRSYTQLLADLTRRIPQHTRQWTDYNDSDPGITLLQLLCWVASSLLHQVNAIPLQTQQNFLRWVLGLAVSSNQTPYSQAAAAQHDHAFVELQALLARLEAGTTYTEEDLQRAVLSYLDRPYAALSLRAVEILALETNAVIATQAASPAPLLLRRADASLHDEATVVFVLSNAPWQYHYPSLAPPPPSQGAGTRRKVLLLQPQDHSQAEQKLLAQVRSYLAPRVLAGASVQVRQAQLTDVDLRVHLTCEPSASLDIVLNALMIVLFEYLLPTRKCSISAAETRLAWSYDQAPDAAQLQQLMLDVPGVRRILALQLHFIPTLALNVLAQLGVNTLLAALPAGTTAQAYRGLPRLRCLDVSVSRATGTQA